MVSPTGIKGKLKSFAAFGMAVLAWFKRRIGLRCGTLILLSVGSLILINNYMAVVTSFEDNLKRALRLRDQEYIKHIDKEQPGGDMPCDGQENCVTSVVHSLERAQQQCNQFGDRCKGFVYHAESGSFFPKIDITGQMEVRKDYVIYLKKQHASQVTQQNIEVKTVCAAPLHLVQIVNASEKCHLMKMDIQTDTIKNRRKLHCSGQRITSYKNGVLTFLDKSTKVITISYKPVLRTPSYDWGFDFGEEKILDAAQRQFHLKDEFIQVNTKTADGNTCLEWHGQVISNRDAVVARKKRGGLPVNVMILGFDTLSHAHFQRALPDAYNYMKNELNSTFLNAYGIVGDGTTPALTALLTGQSEVELPEARKGYENSKPVDDWPWIFKEYKEQGYVTMYSEDAANLGTFTYRLQGFSHPPTDHYSRYFWTAVGNDLCSYATPQHLMHLSYVKSYFDAYPLTKKFGFAFLGDLGHNNQDNFYYAGDNLYDFLKTLHQSNFLNDTILFVMSDHGVRFAASRATFQGRLEERLPLMSVALPPWFETVYPRLVRNLKHNTNSVASPFDLHKTLQHILTYPELPMHLKTYKSFFEEIPKSRPCAEARIDEHYCPCLQWNAADKAHPHIKQAAKFVVEHINKLTSSDNLSARLCQRLQLDKILTGYQQMPNNRFQRFLGPFDIHGRNPKFAKTLEIDECDYQIQFRTRPGGGVFEASVKYLEAKFTVSGEISRLNRYGDQPKCILKKRNDLRKYCLCQS